MAKKVKNRWALYGHLNDGAFTKTLRRVFENGLDYPMFSKVSLNNGEHLRIDVKPGSFSLNGSNIAIEGKLDEHFNISAIEYKSIQEPQDKDYASVLDGLKNKNLKFLKTRTTKRSETFSEIDPLLPSQI